MCRHAPLPDPRPWSVAAAVAALLLFASPAPAQHGGHFDDGRRINNNLIDLEDVRSGDTLYPVRVNGWWGMMNQNGDLVVYPRFAWLDDPYDGLIRALGDNGQTGFINSSGSWRIPAEFPYADRFAEGFAVVGDGQGKFGYIDQRGDLHVPIRLDGALRYKDNAAVVRVGNRIGYLDSRGRVLIEPRFVAARSFHEGVAVVWALRPGGDRRVRAINKSGRVLFEDRRGRIEDLGDFNDGLAAVRIDGRWGYIDRNFKLVIQPRFEDARDMENGLAAVQLNGKWGYIDRAGQMRIEPAFEDADDFDDIRAMVRFDGRYGYVDRAGQLVIDPVFDHARPFFRRYARVDAGGPSFGYITKSGHVLWSPQAARRGFIDTTARERARIGVSDFNRFNRTLAPPSPRPAEPEPYPPDHFYEEYLEVPPNLLGTDGPAAKTAEDADLPPTRPAPGADPASPPSPPPTRGP